MLSIRIHEKLSQLGMGVALAFVIGAPMAVPAQAQSVAANEAKTRVNIAGRERMLIQRVVKSACFSSLGTMRDEHRQQLIETQDLFEYSLTALQSGNPDLGLGAETSVELLAQLGVISSEWAAISNLANDAVSPEAVSVDELRMLDGLGLELLAKMNNSVHEISQYHSQQLDELPVILSITIDIAGRQRMLSQKMAKEFCLIDAGVDAPENMANLAESVRLFDITLSGLQSGMPGMVIAAPNYDIRQKLQEVASLWAPIYSVLQDAAGGGEISDQGRTVIITNMEAVLKAMNEAVGMYEYVSTLPQQ